jgi:hypothetical protein
VVTAVSIRSTNLLLVDEVPTGFYDPEKPVRAAAFAGWAMVAPDSPTDVDVYLQSA